MTEGNMRMACDDEENNVRELLVVVDVVAL